MKRSPDGTLAGEEETLPAPPPPPPSHESDDGVVVGAGDSNPPPPTEVAAAQQPAKPRPAGEQDPPVDRPAAPEQAPPVRQPTAPAPRPVREYQFIGSRADEELQAAIYRKWQADAAAMPLEARLPHVCRSCNKRFASSVQLGGHMRKRYYLGGNKRPRTEAAWPPHTVPTMNVAEPVNAAVPLRATARTGRRDRARRHERGGAGLCSRAIASTGRTAGEVACDMGL
ncbi:hypothetical protein ACP4OV_024700 [Aristida adscensionis]